MSLTCVNMSQDVWLTCLTHALSTETEEIMGLLLGDIEYSKDGNVTALLWGASPQPRCDRKKDPVETNPEHLAAASRLAERLTESAGRTTRVIGWYHSHPHITVLPSHVDLRTQAMYQLLDPGFIGLIFSCFSEDAEKVGRIQVIAFQSSDGNSNTSPEPTSVVLAKKDSVVDLESPQSSAWGRDPEKDTATTSGSKGGGRVSDFRHFFVNNDEAKSSGKDGTTGNDSSASETDQMDDDLQEAILRSKSETSGAGYVRKEVPIHVLPNSSILQLDSPLASFKDLQRVLYKEERAAYGQSLLQSSRAGKIHPLTYIHNTSTYQATLCKLMELCLSPAINALQARLRENNIRLAMLEEEAEVLEAQGLKEADKSECPSRRVRIKKS